MRCLLQSTVNIDKVVIHILKHVNSGRTNYSPIGLKSQKLTITLIKVNVSSKKNNKNSSLFILFSFLPGDKIFVFMHTVIQIIEYIVKTSRNKRKQSKTNI